jgi:hypothetical protein
MLALRSSFFSVLLLLTACTAYVPAHYAYGGGGQYGFGGGYYTSYAPAVRVIPPAVVPYPVRTWGNGHPEHFEHREQRRYERHEDNHGGAHGHDYQHRHGG